MDRRPATGGMGSLPTTPMATTPTPTTFVQADTTTFRELVQKLTGAAEDATEKLPVTLPARFSGRSSNTGDVVGPRRSAFKLQERRQNMRKLEIKLGLTSIRHSGGGAYSPRQAPPHLVISPIQSPVTPLGSDPLFSGQFPASGSESPSSPAMSEEEKTRAEKGFFFQPSPLSTPRGSDPPELLPLFPLHSPKQQSGDP